MTDGPIRVVLADDAPDLRTLLTLALGRDGRFEVVGQAENGEEAVRCCAENAPDAIVLDIAMPVMDGLQAIPPILAAVPDITIMILSGFSETHMAKEALDLGAHAYVEKGATLKDIADRLAELVAVGDPEAP